MCIKSNVGKFDRLIRLITGFALMYLAVVNNNLVSDPVSLGIVSLFGVINLFVAITAWCPMYHLINLNTITHHPGNQ